MNTNTPIWAPRDYDKELIQRAYLNLGFNNWALSDKTYAEAVQKLIGVKVDPSDLRNRSSEKFYHIRAVAELSYATNYCGDSQMFPLTERFRSDARSEFVNFFISHKYDTTHGEKKSALYPSERTKRIILDEILDDDYKMQEYQNLDFSDSNCETFYFIRSLIKTIEYDKFDWIHDTDRRVRAFRQLCFEDLIISFEDLRFGLEGLNNTIYSDTAFTPDAINGIRKESIENYKKIFLA